MVRKAYLTLYNAAQAAAWSYGLFQTLTPFLHNRGGFEASYGAAVQVHIYTEFQYRNVYVVKDWSFKYYSSMRMNP
jgi:hypothetical protein